LRGIVDTQAILHKRGVAVKVLWCMGIDQNLKDGAAATADGFEGNGKDGPSVLPQICLKLFGDGCTHGKILL
jgi:hypothetical protein